MTLIGENDWLGTTPLFYNQRTGAVSRCIHEVIDLRSFEFDPDGLRDYLDFGYCVFGHTPVRDVRFLPPCTRLVRTASGGLCEESLPDPVDQWAGYETRENSVIEALRTSIGDWEQSVDGPIILPMSGGLDSRILSVLVKDKARLRAFTYGISDRPEQSSEVVIARHLSRDLGIHWDPIHLGNFHQYLGRWDDLFGCSTHAHGMYHISFYEQIRARTQPGLPLLSGIVGDAWAGSIGWIPVSAAGDLVDLGYSHGMTARQIACRCRGTGEWREDYWSRHKDKLIDPRFQVVEIVRLKMMLLRYLLEVPRSAGFCPWSPFIDAAIALAMVCLPRDRRVSRAWQHDFFSKLGLDFSNRCGSRQNSLDLRTLTAHPVPPLDTALLSELFDSGPLDRINRILCEPRFGERLAAELQTYPRGHSLARRFRLQNPILQAYASYCTLKPIEQLLRRRNNA